MILKCDIKDAVCFHDVAEMVDRSAYDTLINHHLDDSTWTVPQNGHVIKKVSCNK